MTLKEIYIIHKDWEGLCILNENIIYRKNFKEEYGKYYIKRNKLTIKWEKWNEEDFFFMEDSSYYYYKIIFDNKYSTFYIFESNQIFSLILNKLENNFIILKDNTYSKSGFYSLDNNKINLILDQESYSIFKFNDLIYCKNEDLNNNIFFELSIMIENINEKFIFNKISKKFVKELNIEYEGTYNIVDNCITMIWHNGYSKKFYTNKYESFDKINENITIIKPNNIILENRIFFSNISLCKNKIILTSIHYLNSSWNFSEIDFIIKNNKIINKIILDNDKFESSLSILLELENISPNLFLKIIYKKKIYI